MPVSREAINLNNYYAGRICFPGYAHTVHIVLYVLCANVSFQTTEVLDNIILTGISFLPS